MAIRPSNISLEDKTWQKKKEKRGMLLHIEYCTKTATPKQDIFGEFGTCIPPRSLRNGRLKKSHRIHVWYIYRHCKNQPNAEKVTIHGSYGQFSGEPNAKTQGDAGPQEHVSYLQRGCRSPFRMLHETEIST